MAQASLEETSSPPNNSSHSSPLFVHSLPEIRKGVVAKSGTASLTRGCSGYIGRIAFAILINHCQDSAAAEQKIQAVISQLIDYK